MSDAELRVLGEEHAALRRIATLAARAAPPEEVFAAAVAEVGRVLPVDLVSMGRYDADGGMTFLTSWGTSDDFVPIGTRLTLGGRNLNTIVFETGGPARMDSYDDASGPVGVAVRDGGVRSAVGAPVIVEGRVWGMMAAGSSGTEPLPAGTEARLASFTELLATAIANAESRAALARLAEEQAALRRVATLVARGVPPADVFATVAEEIGRLLPADMANVGHYAPDGTVTDVAAWSATGDPFPGVEGWLSSSGTTVGTLVFETVRPARVDGCAEPSGAPAAETGELCVSSAVGAPIVVDGRLWGVIGVGSSGAQPLPADSEARLAAFTELVATAIANTESRARLGRLAEEQAALRGVATLVARGAPPDELFAAVVDEVGRVLRVDLASVCRYEPDGTLTWVAAFGTAHKHFPVGTRRRLGGTNLGTIVFETGRSVRMDHYADAASGPIGDSTRAAGINSSIAIPITVEGRLWGVIAAGSMRTEPLPPETEARLASFTALVGTAISNAHARSEVGRLAEEQAALRRVATLVARGVPQSELFGAVTEEVGRLIGAELAGMIRYETDTTVAPVAAWSAVGEHPALPDRWPTEKGDPMWLIARTGGAARMDDWSEVPGPIAAFIRRLGVRSSVGSPILVEGRLWGALAVHTTESEPLPPDAAARLGNFTDLVATAISNTEAWTEVGASRARIVAAADAERRRVVRDLHDGAQQRLVHTVITLAQAQSSAENGSEDAPALLAEAREHAERAMVELRELAHGILPVALTHGGLDAGVEALASRVPVVVENRVSVGRLPAAVEATAYFVVAEALTNVAKHAHARRATVTARVADGALRVEVHDDGVGGARPDGTGLLGLADRLAVLDGELRVDSPAGGGTVVAAAIPLPAGRELRPGSGR